MGEIFVSSEGLEPDSTAAAALKDVQGVLQAPARSGEDTLTRGEPGKRVR